MSDDAQREIPKGLRIAAGFAAALVSVFGGWSLVKGSIMGETWLRHQEDMMRVEEEQICWTKHEEDIKKYRVCLKEYDRFRTQRRLERLNKGII